MGTAMRAPEIGETRRKGRECACGPAWLLGREEKVGRARQRREGRGIRLGFFSFFFMFSFPKPFPTKNFECK